jgi:DNA repair exonuclease SbcCD ATPase subunit
MLKNITYSVAFPINQVALEGKFEPQPGLTAVIGPNGVGKTFGSIEMSRFLLYGKAALRGPASDYKKLDASGVVNIKGADYTIARSSKKETITDTTGEVLAVGADAVNKKIIELMGYGLSVFDVCNASVQKKADIFGAMRPAERKRMVDEVVGLTSNEQVEKAVKNEAATYKREAEALTRQLFVPEKPVKPDDYETSSDLGLEYAQDEDRYKLAQKLRELIRPEKEIPKPDGVRPKDGEREVLIARQDKHKRVEAQRKALQAQIVEQTENEYTPEQLEKAVERLAYHALAENAVTCPTCGDNFVPGVGHVTMPDGPDLTREEIRRHGQMMRLIEDSNKARAELAALPKTQDVNEELHSVNNLIAQWNGFDALTKRAEGQRVINANAKRDLALMGDVPTAADLDALKTRLFDARYYERLLNDYQVQQDRYEKTSAEIAEALRLADAFREGATSLADARATLKALLAPSLSRVASRLLNDMTNGKYSEVIVDDDMEITVNGQSIETLSGGNETVANIALRLALGQVLVVETFPVFLGDEMDAFADESRREAVAEAMAALLDKGHLKQVILVTHRGVAAADHVIDLGNTE